MWLDQCSLQRIGAEDDGKNYNQAKNLLHAAKTT